jgi:hypothetical protein
VAQACAPATGCSGLPPNTVRHGSTNPEVPRACRITCVGAPNWKQYVSFSPTALIELDTTSSGVSGFVLHEGIPPPDPIKPTLAEPPLELTLALPVKFPVPVGLKRTVTI